jgi:hypothetical protein
MGIRIPEVGFMLVLRSSLAFFISTNPNIGSAFALHEVLMRSFGFLPEVFLGCLHFLRLDGIDLGKQNLSLEIVKSGGRHIPLILAGLYGLAMSPATLSMMPK